MNRSDTKVYFIDKLPIYEKLISYFTNIFSPQIPMIHAQSASCLPSANKKRRSSVSKNKQSGQKVQSNCNELVKKISHKQSKQKILIMQNTIDQDQYKDCLKQIYNLNDRTFLTALDDLKYTEANKVLQEVRQLINVFISKLLIFSQPTTVPIKNTFTIICLFITVIRPMFFSSNLFIQFRLDDSEGSAKEMEESIRNFQYAQGYILSREQNLTHSSELIKLNLQYFTLLSNLSKHLEAIVSAQKCIQKLSESFRVLDAICTENLVYHDTPDTIATQSQSRVKSQKVNFKRIVIKEAQKLLKQVDISSPHKLMTENKQKFEQKLKNMYFWKTNLENNAKLVHKEVQKGKQVSSNRNLLGVQKTSNFTQEFSLGQLMNLNTRKMKQKLNNDQYFLLSGPKIIQMVLFASVCYFTIATQTRFKQIDSDIGSLKITQKYKKLNKDEIIFKCKVLHLKAIELAAKHLPETNSYFNHILNSFNKNYKSVLDEINEQSESSMKSYDKSLQKYRKKLQAHEQGLNQEYGMGKMHSQNTLHASSKKEKLQINQKMEKLQRSVHQNNTITMRKRILSKDKKTLSKRKTSVSKR